MYSDHGTAIDGKGRCSFGYDSTKNVISFGFANSSSSHADNCKSNCLVLDQGDTFGINGSFGAPEKLFSINFSKGKTKFCFSLHYKGNNSDLFLNGKNFKFKTNNGNDNFPTQLCLGSISNGFDALESGEVSLKGIFMIFQSITMLLINLTY